MSAQGGGSGAGRDDGTEAATDDVARFAALLEALKEGTDRSYGSLARRLGMNTSTLHRYCAGETVPVDFAPVERFASLCGASAEQRLELHRLWLLAVEARQRPRPAKAVGSAASVPAAPVAPREAEAETRVDGPAADAPVASAAPLVSPAPDRRPWYRRGRLMAGLVSAGAVLATLGAFSAFPDRGQPSGSGPDRVSGTAQSRVPGNQGPSPSPSDASPVPPSASGSSTPTQQPDDASSPSGPKSGSKSEPPRGQGNSALPISWAVNSHAWKFGCGHDYVIAKPPGEVPPPPVPQDAGSWAASQSALHGGETLLRLTVQGRDTTAVVLEALRVRVIGRAAPAQGHAYAMDAGCGGALTPRSFAVDLDKDRPIVRPVAGNDSGTPIPAARLPYRVSAKDPEVLLVSAATGSCDCRWYLELEWSSQGRTGTVRIDDHGRPFRTTAISGLPRYTYNTLDRRWEDLT